MSSAAMRQIASPTSQVRDELAERDALVARERAKQPRHHERRDVENQDFRDTGEEQRRDGERALPPDLRQVTREHQPEGMTKTPGIAGRFVRRTRHGRDAIRSYVG
jgi:hypothetical protein